MYIPAGRRLGFRVAFFACLPQAGYFFGKAKNYKQDFESTRTFMFKYSIN
jgi:hypothetical protein